MSVKQLRRVAKREAHKLLFPEKEIIEKNNNSSDLLANESFDYNHKSAESSSGSDSGSLASSKKSEVDLREGLAKWATECNTSLLQDLVKEIKQLRSEVSEIKLLTSDLKAEITALKESNKRGLLKLTEEVVSVKMENRKNSTDFDADVLFPDIPKLPLSAISEVVAFDEEVQKNESQLRQFKHLISKVGGDGPTQFIRAAIRKVFSDKVASEYSWKGTKAKPSAERCYIVTVMKNIATEKYKCTDKDLNTVLQKHFVHANDRLAKRRRLE